MKFGWVVVVVGRGGERKSLIEVCWRWAGTVLSLGVCALRPDAARLVFVGEQEQEQVRVLWSVNDRRRPVCLCCVQVPWC